MSADPIVWKGGREWDEAIDNWVARALDATAAGLKAAQESIVTETQAEFGSGDGPANVSGELSGSVIGTEPERSGLYGYEAQVGPSGVEYARKVELGKRGAHHGAPHPYLQPGFARAARTFVNAFTDAWADAGKG